MNDLTFSMQAFVDQQNSPNTRDAYARDLHVWLKHGWGMELPPNEAVGFKKYLMNKYAPSTARRIFSTVRSYHNWLTTQGDTGPNPFDGVKAPARDDTIVRVPTGSQVQRILDEAKRDTRARAMLLLLLNGLRASEVCDLRWGDYFATADTMAVRVMGKGRKERIVPLNREAQGAMDAYTYLYGGVSPEAPLFTDINGKPVTRKGVSYQFEKYSKRAGVRGFSPHSFRHNYGTRLYKASKDILGVGKLMGHSKAETTQVYARLDLTDLIATARLDPRDDLTPGV